MDINDIIETDFVTVSEDTTVSKLSARFDDPSVRGVVVTNDGHYRGVVTRRQLTTSHQKPQAKARSLVWHVPRLSPHEDVRETAQLMLDSDSRLLPVFEGETLVGVVTVDTLLEKVEPYLDAATVEDAYTSDLVTVEPESTFGEVLHVLRENRITHLPVVEDGEAVGILSLYDVTEISTRAMTQSQGGDPPSGSGGGFRGHGGWGARDGERARVLDLPVRDVMVSPVRTIRPEKTLEDAVSEMFDAEASSLVVVDEDGRPDGIVTKSDVLEALTWEAEGNRAVQLLGSDLLDDMSYQGVVNIVDKLEALDGDMNVLDAKVHLHEHDEKLRGTPLLLARIRLYTDKGLYMASGEGYGASHAIHEARDALERQIRDGKTYGQSKKHPGEEFWEKRFGWWLESPG